MISFIKGFFDCFSGFRLILKSGIKRFVLIPFLINLGLFSLATKLLTEQVDSWIEQLLPGWLSWLEWLIWPLFAIAMFLIVFYSFTIIANLVAAPFNSLLSARIEALLTDKKPENINSDRFLKLISRTLQSEFKKIIYAIKWFIPLIIITFIPVINVISPFLWMFFAAWFLSLEYNDYPLANRGLFFDEVRTFNRDNRMRSLGLGCGVFILTTLPLINFIAMPVAVAGATRLTIKTRHSTTTD